MKPNFTQEKPPPLAGYPFQQVTTFLQWSLQSFLQLRFFVTADFTISCILLICVVSTLKDTPNAATITTGDGTSGTIRWEIDQADKTIPIDDNYTIPGKDSCTITSNTFG